MRRISRIVGLSALIMRVNFGLASGKKSDGAYERHIELTRSTSSVPHLKFGLLAQAGRQRVALRDNSALLVLGCHSASRSASRALRLPAQNLSRSVERRVRRCAKTDSMYLRADAT